MCECKSLPDVTEIAWDDSPTFDDGFTMVGNRQDVELRRCEECGEYWQIDVGRGGLAIRVNEPESWSEFDDRPARMQNMIDFHGGLTEGTCAWAGCDRQPLRGMALCPHHAYPMLSWLSD